MEEHTKFKLDNEEIRRQWQRYRQRQYQYRLVASCIIRTAIWLLSVYLTHAWNYRAVPFYLLLSIIVFILVLSYGGDKMQSNVSAPPRKRHVDAAEVRNGNTNSYNDQLSTEEVGNDTVVDRGVQPQREHGVRRRTTKRRDNGNAVNTSNSAHQAPSEHLEGQLRTPNRVVEENTALFDGVLTQSQQHALLRAMQLLRTPGATRCAMDPSFRRMLVNMELDDCVSCVCGSGAKFGACCLAVKEQLLGVLETE